MLTVTKHTAESVVIDRSTPIAVRLLFSLQPLQTFVIYISVLAVYVRELCTAVVQIKAVRSSARLGIKYQTAWFHNLKNLTFSAWRIRICLKAVIVCARVNLKTLILILSLHIPCYVTFRNVKSIIVIIILLMIINYMELICMITTFKQNY